MKLFKLWGAQKHETIPLGYLFSYFRPSSTVILSSRTISRSSSPSCGPCTPTRRMRISTRNLSEATSTSTWTWRTSGCSGRGRRPSSWTTPGTSRSWGINRRCWKVTGKSEWSNSSSMSRHLIVLCPITGSNLNESRSRILWEKKLNQMEEGESNE